MPRRSLAYPSFRRDAPQHGSRESAARAYERSAAPFEGLPPAGALVEELSIILALALALALAANLPFVH